MEFLDPNHELNLRDASWRIYSKTLDTTPQQLTKDAQISDSLITDGCYVAGTIDHSILSLNVKVGKGSTIKDSVIMPGTVIGENCHIEKAIVGENAVIYDGAEIIGKIGEIAVVGNEEKVGGYTDEN